MDHDQDSRIQDLRRAHDHAQDAQSAIERSIGRLSPEWRSADELTRIVGAKLEARHDELNRMDHVSLSPAILNKLMEHLGSGNFAADLEVVGPVQVCDDQAGLSPTEIRLIGQDRTYIVQITIKESA